MLIDELQSICNYLAEMFESRRINPFIVLHSLW